MDAKWFGLFKAISAAAAPTAAGVRSAGGVSAWCCLRWSNDELAGLSVSQAPCQ